MRPTVAERTFFARESVTIISRRRPIQGHSEGMEIIKASAGFDCEVGDTGATESLVKFIDTFAPYSVKGKEGEKLRKSVSI